MFGCEAVKQNLHEANDKSNERLLGAQLQFAVAQYLREKREREQEAEDRAMSQPLGSYYRRGRFPPATPLCCWRHVGSKASHLVSAHPMFAVPAQCLGASSPSQSSLQHGSRIRGTPSRRSTFAKHSMPFCVAVIASSDPLLAFAAFFQRGGMRWTNTRPRQLPATPAPRLRAIGPRWSILCIH